MAQLPTSAGDLLPPKCAVIEVHVGELKPLFDAIVGWAKEFPKDAKLVLLVDLEREAGAESAARIPNGSPLSVSRVCGWDAPGGTAF